MEDQYLWLPQFKIGDKTDGHMKLVDEIKNYKVEDKAYLQEYYSQSALEINAAPFTMGNLIIEPQVKDLFVKEPEFYVAVTHTQLENSGIDLPFCVTKIT